jgi:hypothetical protein
MEHRERERGERGRKSIEKNKEKSSKNLFK